MRYLVPAVVVLSLSVAGCNPQAAAAVARDGTLLLELGGNGRSLADELRRLGVQPQELPEPAAATEPTDAPNVAGDAGDGQAPADDPRAAQPAAAAPVEVVLQKGQTLFALAREYLGSAGRFRELLEVNGLTEEQARKLRPGTRLRLPNGSRAGK